MPLTKSPIRVPSLFFLSTATALITTGIRANRLRREFGERTPIVLITGGSRGLGFAIAKQWAKIGAKICLCARNGDELEAAREKLVMEHGADVSVFACDLSHPKEIKKWIANCLERFGRIDVLVNNAGVIDVGPLQTLDEHAFETALETNLWGPIRVSLAAIPHLEEGARIVNIASIGGAVAVPHLLPYSVSKFGVVGFSRGLDAELGEKKISVTTILPGLMRTGSAIHAMFRGDRKGEFNWFSVGASLPIISISAEEAARAIVFSSLARRRFVVLGPTAKALYYFQSIFPGATQAVLRQVNRIVLPKAKGNAGEKSVPGSHIGENVGLNKVAEIKLNEKREKKTA